MTVSTASFSVRSGDWRDKHTWVPMLTWVALSLLLVRHVLVYGTRVPSGDDWMMLRLLRPELPFHSEETSLGFESPFWIARWAFVLLVGGFDDIRAGAWLTVLLMPASAWVCMRTARALRGHTHITDACFPLLLLHGAHSANTSSSIQVGYALFAALLVLGFRIAATFDERPGAKCILLMALVGALAPLTWSGGLPHGIFWCLALVLVWRAARRSTEAHERRTGKLARAGAFVIAVITVASFVAYLPRPELEASSPKLFAAAALRFLSRGIGESAVLFRPIASWFVIAAAACALYLLARALFVSNAMRNRAIGVALVFVAMCATAYMVGLRRLWEGDGSGLHERYGLVAAPLWCGFGITAALAWDRHAARVLAWFLFVVAGLCFLPNFLAGEREGLVRRSFARALEGDLSSELSIEEIVSARWQEANLLPVAFTAALQDFEALHLGPFAQGEFRRKKARPPPPFESLYAAPIIYPEPADMRAGEAEGQPALFVRDGRQLEIVINPEPILVRGAFGLHTDPAEATAAPRARFEVGLIHLDGTTSLIFARLLDPAAVPADRGAQHFSLLLHRFAANGNVILRIVHEEGSRDSMAGYWRDVLVR